MTWMCHPPRLRTALEVIDIVSSLSLNVYLIFLSSSPQRSPISVVESIGADVLLALYTLISSTSKFENRMLSKFGEKIIYHVPSTDETDDAPFSLSSGSFRLICVTS
ncbi:hypothetical protein SISSUDRAFT_576662 [Sistotremastrum suecicum HHB10207 ss-3]|uniref:Uncharacterized protein n=1 Tax=Sistotremastrum suecicum HHB10207 ss-3 TaxID=1314776 RepID=A0A165XF90_9AGAM|nr:hypothetical protein SISSUDRAFT_576662 [Sistotremastrum suecicum HHB10207 ss-3]